ncbi:MAG TPA: choice-of-anchor X domain-containing protein [Kofleriaceae bacterium]|jgi:hypothetical protein|nr:choice-of-anchor X domain-containing protein [Kofleriaceae bacterium]
MTIERRSVVTSAVIAALVSGCGPQARPGGGAVGACAAEAAHCTAAAQCCSNRCEFSRGATAGVCTSPAELDGPLAALPADRKHADLRLDPPAVLEASAVAGPDGGSIVNVRFADDPRLGPTVALASDNGPLVLHDDGTAGDARAGDRIYAAALPVAFAQLQADERRVLADLARRHITQVPQFDGPEIVAERKIDPAIDPSRVHLFDPVPAFDPARTLLITDLGVVEDPARTFNPCTQAGTAMGTWTFGYLMSQIANQPVTGVDPADLVLDWLHQWDDTQLIDGNTAPRRTAIDGVIAQWPKVAATGKLDLARAPLKLLAIVNRIDLAGNPSYGHVGGAEGRFVFGVLGPGCATRPFTVIVEYGVPRRTCSSLRQWALAWEALDAMTPGTTAYNAALEALTQQFASASADPGKLAGSALDQLRSDENALHAPGDEQPQWELREFTLQPTAAGVRLREATVKQTPDDKFNGAHGGARAGDLATWINAHQPDILASTHTVPDVLPFPPGDGFLGAATLNFFNPINGMFQHDFWTASGIASNAARHKFSLATCNGCHGAETGTSFLHVGPASFGSAASLSGFLTGATVPDPVVPATKYHFDELAARAVKLAQFAGAACSRLQPPIALPHAAFPLPPLGVRPALRAH